jgi:hypothetical protein
MKLYEVVYEGQPDWIYLVRASTFEDAIREVKLNSTEIGWSTRVFELGTEESTQAKDGRRILRGPYRGPAYNYGWKEWHRKIVDADFVDEWVAGNSPWGEGMGPDAKLDSERES